MAAGGDTIFNAFIESSNLLRIFHLINEVVQVKLIVMYPTTLTFLFDDEYFTCNI